MSVTGASWLTSNDVARKQITPSLYRNLYRRPSDWIAMPDIADGTQKFIIQYAVFSNNNLNSVSIVAAGNYTIDWGDGVVETYSSGVTSSHTFNYSSSYYDGTLTSGGYKQGLITITPTGAATLTSVNLNTRNATTNTPQPWLDVYLNSTALTAPTMPTGSGNGPWLERVRIKEHAITSWGSMCNNMYNLKCFELLKPMTGSTNSLSSMFGNCYNLVAVNGGLNWRGITSTANMFQNARKLAIAPWMDLSLCTDASVMFNSCFSLTYVPQYNTSAVTNSNAMFQTCYSLQSIPAMNWGNVTNATNMFQGSTSLYDVGGSISLSKGLTAAVSVFSGTQVPTSISANVAGATDLSNFVASNNTLTEAPTLTNTTAVTNMSGMFNTCSGLINPPSYNTANVTNMSSMFTSCYNLESLPAHDLTKVTNLSAYCNSDWKLKSIPTANVRACTNFGSTLQNCTGLSEINWYNINAPLDIPACAMTKTTLENVFANLLPRTATANTMNIGSMPATTTYSKTSVASTANSLTITLTNTVSLTVGMLVTGANINSGITSTATTGTDTITVTNHQLPANTLVSFNAAVGNTAAYTPVYTTNITANTFQITNTPGGTAITITANATPTLYYGRYVANIVANTSVTLTTPASNTGTGTVVFRTLDTTVATLKNWTIVG